MQQRNRIRLGFQWAFGLALCALIAFPLDAAARGIEEFDKSFGVWKISPKKVSGTKTPGWKVVQHSGEGAAENTPTKTKYTYYWKLTRTYDLTDVKEPELDLKFSTSIKEVEKKLIQICFGKNDFWRATQIDLRIDSGG